MFWRFNNTSSSQLGTLLAKEDVTLTEVMDAEDIINECKGQNKNLIDFLLKPEITEELVTLTTKEPSPELDERVRFKYPNIACELLTCDVPAIYERLAGDKVLLDKLYTFLECEPPLNPLMASYFSKLMGALIAKKSEQNWLSYQFTCLQVLDFLKAKETFISLLLKHLGTSAIMDLTLKLITQVEGVEMRQNILNWLDSQRIMQSLVSLLNPQVDSERHFYVAQLLCDFIKIARENLRNSTERADPDPLLNTLESPETVSLLLDNILGEDKSETAIVGGIQVLLALLDVFQTSIPKFNIPSIYYNPNINDEANDLEQKQKVIANTTQAIRVRLLDFHNLLLNPPNKMPIESTVGLLDPPLGNTRLQVVRLFAALLSSSNDELLLHDIIRIGTFPVLLDLFFQYPWNNFLHTQVENCLINALKTNWIEENEGESDALYKHLLGQCRLIQRILNAWRENDLQQSQEKGVRQGYMGHLISITNKFVELCSTTTIGQYLKDNMPEVSKKLKEFKETTLSETNKIQFSLLAGVHPNNSIEDNDDYGDIPFSQSSLLSQQMFSQYQIQHLASSYTDTGFNDDAFNDGEDTLQTIDHRTDTNFDLSEGDIRFSQYEVFKQVCAQNINSFDDSDDQIFEDKEHTFQTVIEKQCDPNETFSDSDDESPLVEENMDVDAWASPKLTEQKNVVPLMASDPWGLAGDSNAPQTDTNVGGWADFSSVSFEESFSNAFNNSSDDSGAGEKKAEEDDVKLTPAAAETVEKDLKVENIDDGNIVDVKDESTNITKESLAQEAEKTADGEKIKSAAGDQKDEEKEVMQTSASPTNEPSKQLEENSGNASETGSATEKDKSTTENV